MKSISLCFLAMLSLTAILQAESFRIYAPSSKTSKLWIVEAKQTDDQKLSLSVAEKIDLGFAGRVLTAHPEKPLLYITAVSGDVGEVPGGAVKLDSEGNYVEHHPLKFNAGSCYMSLDRTQRFLFGISYRNGQLNVYPLNKKAIPGKPVTTIDEGRKAAHCVLVSPDNKNLYIPYVKDSLALQQYQFDAKTGSVTPLSPKNANPPEGTGPRHMAYHPKLPMVYFSNEQGVGLSVYQRQADGQLKFHQNIEVLPDGISTDGLSASDLEITSDGKYLFAGLRGHRQDFDHITRYRIKENGDAELLGLTKADKIPWGLAISPGGKYLLVSATNGASLTAYSITKDGDLVEAAKLDWDAGISDLITR